MPRENILRNRKRVLKDIIDEDAGEKLVRGSFDADVSVVYGFGQNPRAKRPKGKRMTIFATNHRIIAYQASGMFASDKFAELPLTELDCITFAKFENGENLVAVSEFIAFPDSNYPSLLVSFDASGHPLDMKSFALVISGISKLSGARIIDETDKLA